MIKEIILKDKKIEYKIRKSKKAKHLKLVINNNAEILVVIPWRLSNQIAEEFLYQKIDWVLKILRSLKDKPVSLISKSNEEDYQKYKKLALEVVKKKINYFNTFYKFSFNRITIKNQKTRWGSCSIQGNLNFNYRIIFLNEKLCDYIVVHELCHLKEMNHSKRFWGLVAKTILDHKTRKKIIRSLE